MRELLESRELWIAVGVAFAVALMLVVGHAIGRRWYGGAGLVAVVGALVGATTERHVPLALVAGVVLLGVAAAICRRWSRVVGAAATVPGAALVGFAVHDNTPAPSWVPIVVAVASGVAAVTVVDFEDAQPRLVGVCVFIAAAGVYATVPDTDYAIPLVGATAVAALLGLVPDAVPMPAGSAAALAFLMWSVGFGGWTRPGAVVGGVACTGVLVLGLLLLRVVRPHPLAIVVAQIVLVVVTARVAGLRESAAAAAAIAVAAFVVAALALVVAGRVAPARDQRRRAARSR